MSGEAKNALFSNRVQTVASVEVSRSTGPRRVWTAELGRATRAKLRHLLERGSSMF